GDRDADGVTVLSVRLRGFVTTERIQAVANVGLYYDEFWATNDLDNLNGKGTVAGRAEVWKNLFFVDAIAEKEDVYTQPSQASASRLTTGQGSIQEKDYAVSPFIQTDLFSIADLLVRGNYGQIEYEKPVVGVTTALLTDVTVKSAAGRITTGE